MLESQKPSIYELEETFSLFSLKSKKKNKKEGSSQIGQMRQGDKEQG